MVATVEELLEMAGVLVFLWALLDYSQTHMGRVTIRFGKS
jgi:hypothetical protein